MGASPNPRLSLEEGNLSVEEQISSLIREGRIREAKELLESSGDLVPAESKIREILAPARVRKSDKRDVDRTPEFRWLKEHWDEHQGQWVALVGESLVASSDTFKGLLTQLEPLRSGFERKPLIHHLI